MHSFRSFKVYSPKTVHHMRNEGHIERVVKFKLTSFFGGCLKLKNVHTCESFLHVSDCFTEIEKYLDDVLHKGDFAAIDQTVTPKTLARCKTNTLIKSFQVGLVTLSLPILPA